MPRPKKSRRGGKRPGAGAPKGNLNALKHGRRSRQFAELVAALVASPAMRQAFLLVAQRENIKQAKADQLAWNVLQNALIHGIKVGKDREGNVRLMRMPRIVDGRTIEESTRPRPTPRHKTTPEKPQTPPDNQTPDTNPADQSIPKHENPIDRTS